MANHPLNLAVRFALELAALAALALWGWSASPAGWRIAAAVGLPIAAAAAWGTFRVAGDASHNGDAPVEVPGAVRLALELGLFGLAAAALFAIGRPVAGTVLVASVVAHYLVSLERVTWLLGR